MPDFQSDDILNKFNLNTDPEKAMYSLTRSLQRGDRAPLLLDDYAKVYSEKIGALVAGMMNDRKKIDDLEELAKSGDLAALACLGAWHLINKDETRAHQYFRAVANSPLNRSNGELEHAIGSWLKEPYEKAKYFRLSMWKGCLKSAPHLLLCLPEQVLFGDQFLGQNLSRPGLGWRSFTVGTFHLMFESATGTHQIEMNTHDGLIPPDRQGLLFKKFVKDYPEEFKKICIQSSIAKVGIALRDPDRAVLYFRRYQAELVDKILADLIEKNISILDDNQTNAAIAEAVKKYENDYHAEYLTNIPTLIRERQAEIERKAPEAIQVLEKSMNQKMRDLLDEMIALSQQEKMKNPSKSLAGLGFIQQAYLEEQNSHLETFDRGSDLSLVEKQYLEKVIGQDRLNVENPMYLGAANSVEKRRIILELSAAAMVAHGLSSPPHYEDMDSPTPSTKKLMRAISTINKATDELSNINTEASKFVALTRNEFIAYSLAQLVPIIGIPLLIASGISRYKYGTFSVESFKQREGKTKLASNKALNLFKEATKKTTETAQHLPAVARNKQAKSK